MCRNRKLFTLAAMLVASVLVVAATPSLWAQSNSKNLHTFTKEGAGGSEPTGGLVMDQVGNLYGTAAFGGTREDGTVFKLTPGSNGHWTETVLHSFLGGEDGSIPIASMVFDQAGNLYGTTAAGGAQNWGTVFELTANSNGSWTESVLYSFCSVNKCSDGGSPASSLIFDSAGNLYGTTREGGTTGCGSVGCGTVFELMPQSNGSWKENVLYTFCPTGKCTDGEAPYAGVIFDQAGNLYGTTNMGGSGKGPYGTVFELSPNSDGSWKETVLHSFCNLSKCLDGDNPLDSLVFDQSGNLYGTAELGGEVGGGIVFELSPNSNGTWQGKILHSFAGKDGDAPYANLIFDQAGNLYGTTFEGGPGGGGVVFELKPNGHGGWDDYVLHNFYDNPGAIVFAGVIMDPAGNLYGVTYGDSNNTFGSVFEIMP